MLNTSQMKPLEVSMIEGYDGTLVAGGTIQNGLIGRAQSRETYVLNCQHIVSESSEFENNGQIEILIGEQQRHCASCLGVGTNSRVNVVTMLRVIIPGDFQVGRRQVGMPLDDLRIGQS
jgi:hypothetical protein